MSSLGTVKNQLSPASVGCFGWGGSVVVAGGRGECLLFLADKNISVLDLVMPREDYRLADSSSGLYSLSGGWLPVLETGAKVAYIVIGAGWKQEPHLELWPRIVATRNYLFDQGSALILPCRCGGDAQVCTPVARGEVCLRQKDEKEHACTCFSPPFKRRRPGSLPSRCLLLFPLIDLWDLGFFFFVGTSRGL